MAAKDRSVNLMPTPDRPINVLFLCTGNSARSILAESALNVCGKGRFRAYSAGSRPVGKINPWAVTTLENNGYPIKGLRSKSWDEFAVSGAPKMDIIITVCDDAAGQVCPVWPGHPASAHWRFPDPAAFAGSEEEILRGFDDVFRRIAACVGGLSKARLPVADKSALKGELDRIYMRGGKAAAQPSPRAAPGPFGRRLTLWVALCIIVGIGLGYFFPASFRMLGAAEIARVNLPVAALVWLMIIPMLMKIDFGDLRRVGEHWKGIGVTLLINWGIKPFSMAALGAFFIGYVFAPYLPSGQVDSYIAGLILLAAAPCTAMVFVWSNLCDGDPHFTLSQVALNDAIMIFAFAPLVGLLLGLSAIVVPWETLLLSVALYIVVPVIISQGIRRLLIAKGGLFYMAKALKAVQPTAATALLATLVLLFGFQGEQVIAQPLIIVLLAVPIVIQVYLNSGVAYLLNRRLGTAHCVAGPSALIGASNFFELAVAAAVSLFGVESGAALATVVGVLIEVPVMLSVVKIVNATKGWYEAAPAFRRRNRNALPS